MQNDLISRSALLGKLRFAEEHGNGFGLAFPIELVEVAPTVDAVEVVRCRDCIYYKSGKDYFPYCNHPDGGIEYFCEEDDFCSYGERRD